MARAKYQVLVLPYKKQEDRILYCIFKRSDMDAWQFIAGGGEDEDASPLVSAKEKHMRKPISLMMKNTMFWRQNAVFRPSALKKHGWLGEKLVWLFLNTPLR